MDSDVLSWVIPLAAIIGAGIGWLGRQYWQRREARRQAWQDSIDNLVQQKIEIEDQISRNENLSIMNRLTDELELINAAIRGLRNKRLEHTLKEIGLSQRELVTDSTYKLEPSKINEL